MNLLAALTLKMFESLRVGFRDSNDSEALLTARRSLSDGNILVRRFFRIGFRENPLSVCLDE